MKINKLDELMKSIADLPLTEESVKCLRMLEIQSDNLGYVITDKIEDINHKLERTIRCSF